MNIPIADYFPFLKNLLPVSMRPKPAKFVGPTGQPVHGILAEFADPPAVYHAAEQIRDAGFKTWDVYAPFPIHGIDAAMGMPRTKLPLVVGVIGLSGAAMAFGLQWLISDVLYPMVVQGKPYGAWEPFVPITFEVGVLSAAFTTLLGMFALNGLPRFHHPLFKNERFLSSSDDAFFIYVEATDDKFDPERTRAALTQAGATRIDIIEDEA